MKFKQLIQTNAWLSIAIIFQEIYPEDADQILGYKEVFEKLLIMDPTDSRMSIDVLPQKDVFDGEEYVDVSGIYKYPKNDDEKFLHALEFTPWNKWLGMEISEESLVHFSELEIICYCLYEMTFMGFDEEEIQAELSTLESTIDDYKNMTDEEKEMNTTSLEDLLKGGESEDSNENDA